MKSRCFIALVFLTVGRKILPGYFWETVLFSDDWTKLLLASFMLFYEGTIYECTFETYFQATTTNRRFHLCQDVFTVNFLISQKQMTFF